MQHSCLELDRCKMANFDKHPHYLNSSLKDAPDGDGALLTVIYTHIGGNTQLGWGMRFHYCPACGENLGGKE